MVTQIEFGGGTYFRDIYSSVTDKSYKDAWKDLPASPSLAGDEGVGDTWRIIPSGCK